MQVTLIAVGTRMPAWVEAAYTEYSKRLPKDCRLVLKEIALPKRGVRPDIKRLKKQEATLILKAIPKNAKVIGLDETGRQWTTQQWSQQLAGWMSDSQDIALIIGGPDGLDEALRQRFTQTIGLSQMTFPHPLVRVIVAEQIYRAWSVTQNHPYHR